VKLLSAPPSTTEDPVLTAEKTGIGGNGTGLSRGKESGGADVGLLGGLFGEMRALSRVG